LSFNVSLVNPVSIPNKVNSAIKKVVPQRPVPVMSILSFIDTDIYKQ
jgi:hypothetical protein